MTIYRKAIGKPLLIFTMQIDSNRLVIPGFNQGRLALVDDLGEINHWVFSSSISTKQSTYDWNVRGGIIPPTYVMPGRAYWEFHTKRLYQPGQPVDDGFLITFKGQTEYTTVEGGTRSEIMIHDDLNRDTNLGSLGCIVAVTTKEWDDFANAIAQSVAHLPFINLLVLYSY
jgi:hypothetical protein